MNEFAEALHLLNKYFLARLAAADRSFDQHLANELRRRLRQLSYLADRIHVLTASVLAKGDPHDEESVLVFATTDAPGVYSDEEDHRRVRAPLLLEEQLQLDLETFYYIAGRVATIIQQCGTALPGVVGFTADGVIRVRNNLIEHANKRGGERVVSMGISGRGGAWLRALTEDRHTDAYLDRGFDANLRELRDNLEDCFSRALLLS